MFPLPLIVEIRPSRQLRLGAALLHVAAGLALWLADLTYGVLVGGMGILIISLAFFSDHFEPVKLRGKTDGILEICNSEGWSQASRCEVGILVPVLILLHYQPSGQSYLSHLIVLPDSLPDMDFRRLRAWLKWQRRKPDQI